MIQISEDKNPDRYVVNFIYHGMLNARTLKDGKVQKSLVMKFPDDFDDMSREQQGSRFKSMLYQVKHAIETTTYETEYQMNSYGGYYYSKES